MTNSSTLRTGVTVWFTHKVIGYVEQKIIIWVKWTTWTDGTIRTRNENLWFRTRSWHHFDRYATYNGDRDTPAIEYILHLLKCFSIALLFFYCSSLVSSAFALKFVTIFLPMALDWQQFSGHQCKVNIKNQTKVNGRNCKSDGLECSVSRPHCGKCWQRAPLTQTHGSKYIYSYPCILLAMQSPTGATHTDKNYSLFSRYWKFKI